MLNQFFPPDVSELAARGMKKTEKEIKFQGSGNKSASYSLYLALAKWRINKQPPELQVDPVQTIALG